VSGVGAAVHEGRHFAANAIAATAGLPNCTAHGLRKIGATMCAEKGATEHQLMAIFDWSTPQQAAIYTRAASRRHLAAGAMHLLGGERMH
jgi:integrase